MGIIMEKIKIILGASILLLVSVQVNAAIIDNFPRLADTATPSGGIGSLGEYVPFLDGVSSYYGQTFIAPGSEEILASRLIFSMESGSQAPGPMPFRVLMVEATTGVSLSTLLFETSSFLLPGNSGWTDFEISLGNTPLIGGLSYAWILDTFSDRDGVSGIANVGTRNGFADGSLFTLNVAGGTRSSHELAAFADIDLAFQLEFTTPSPVPAPPAIWLFFTGLIGLGLVRRKYGAES